ncbi:hypothetical protein KC930_03590 [Candidatus Saccharibacteria bacterium]|nr:hypothetical protein [Candidatus Saccharibacteria bacterium]
MSKTKLFFSRLADLAHSLRAQQASRIVHTVQCWAQLKCVKDADKETINKPLVCLEGCF